jgi:hypothetical protein
MNPQPGQNVLIHPLARMLPLHRYMQQVYRLAEKFPPGLTDGYAPIWEIVPFTLGARQTQQARSNVQREFHILAIAGSSSAAGGFRAQFYDQKKKRKLTDRGINFANLLGAGSGPLFFREPYALLEDNAQILTICQNQDTVANTIQIVIFGMARRFNFPS